MVIVIIIKIAKATRELYNACLSICLFDNSIIENSLTDPEVNVNGGPNLQLIYSYFYTILCLNSEFTT